MLTIEIVLTILTLEELQLGRVINFYLWPLNQAIGFMVVRHRPWIAQPFGPHVGISGNHLRSSFLMRGSKREIHGSE